MKNSSKLGELGTFKVKGSGILGKAPAKLPPGSPFAGVDYTGDPEKDTMAELNEYQKACKENIRNYQSMIEGIFDSEFWFAVSFKNRDDKDAFLREFGIDKLGNKYIDGGKLAKLLRSMRK